MTQPLEYGTFADHQDYLVGHSAIGLTLGDVTDDGQPDIVLFGDAVTVLHSTPDGISPYQLEYPTGSELSMYWLAVGDLDGDAQTDLVFPTYDGTVSVLLNECR